MVSHANPLVPPVISSMAPSSERPKPVIRPDVSGLPHAAHMLQSKEASDNAIALGIQKPLAPEDVSHTFGTVWPQLYY